MTTSESLETSSCFEPVPFFGFGFIKEQTSTVTYNRNNKFNCFEANNFGLSYILFIFFVLTFLFIFQVL